MKVVLCIHILSGPRYQGGQNLDEKKTCKLKSGQWKKQDRTEITKFKFKRIENAA